MGSGVDGRLRGIESIRAYFVFLKYDICTNRFLVSLVLIFFTYIILQDHQAQGILQEAVLPIQWNNAPMITAIAISFCAASNFARDYQTKVFRSFLTRIGRKAYLLSRFLSCATVSGLAAAIGFILFVVYLVARYGWDVSSVDNLGTFIQFAKDGHYVSFFASIAFAQFLFGFLLGCIGSASASFLPDIYVGYIMPFLVVFFWSQLSRILGMPVWLNPLVLARCLYDVGSLPILIYTVSYIVPCVAVFVIYLNKARRLLNHDA